MVRSENILDLDSAEEDQIDLFYLVDCVLDEIAQAKQAADKEPVEIHDDDDDDIIRMPAASPEYYTPDLMDHIESPLAHYDSDQSYSSHESSFQAHGSFHQSHQMSTVPQISSVADDLLQQGEMTYEYLSFHNGRKLDVAEHSYLCSSKNKTSVLDKDIPTPDMYAASLYSYEKKVDNSTRYNHSRIDNVAIPKVTQQTDYKPGVVELNKDFPKEFSNLHHYSDIVHSGEITSRTDNSLPSQNVSPVYLSQQIAQSHDFYDEESNDTTTSEFVSWTCKHPENWSATEVLDWLYYSAERNGVDCSLLRGESFRTVTGEVLCTMGPDDFSNLEPHYGHFFYKLFRQLINGLRFTLPTDTSFADPSDVDATYTYTDSQNQPYENTLSPRDLAHGHHHPSNELSQGQSSTHTSPEVYQHFQQNKDLYSFEFASPAVPQTNPSTVESLLMQGYDYATSTHDLKYEHMYGYEYQAGAYHMPQRSAYRRAQSDVTSARSRYADSVTPVRRRPGRPRIKSDPTQDEIRAQREKKLKSQHLWEFIFDILNNPSYNPSILKWENQNEGVFRFIQSESVAQLWGTLKNNENMTYEKLSRAMRHYYKRGILERVEGRRLVYKFSQTTLGKMREKRLLSGRD